MAATQKFNHFIGIDVSKNKLDIFDSETGEVCTISNNSKDIKVFIKTKIPADNLLVVIDLTGGYESDAVKAFYASGFNVHRAEGRRVSAFLKALNQHAKTDALDAEALALYGEKMQENLILYEPENGELKALIMRLYEQKDMLQKEKNRAEAPSLSKIVLKSLKASIAFFEKQIKTTEKQIQDEIEKDNNLLEKQKILMSVTGVGHKTSQVILALLPELGYVNRRQIASLTGVAPFAKDSGTLRGYRCVKGGRPEVKRALFMAALVAIKYDLQTCRRYEEMIAGGKKKMVAIVAEMRRLIVKLNAVCKEFYQVG